MPVKALKTRVFVDTVYHTETMTQLSDVLMTPLGCVKDGDFVKGFWMTRLPKGAYLGSYNGRMIVINGHEWIRLRDIYEYDSGAWTEYPNVLGAYEQVPSAAGRLKENPLVYGYFHIAGWLEDEKWIWGFVLRWTAHKDVYGGLNKHGLIIVEQADLEEKVKRWEFHYLDDDFVKIMTGDASLFYRHAVPVGEAMWIY